MQVYSSCKDAIQDCLNRQYFSIAHLYNDEKPMDIHIHDNYEIYYSISGGKQFLIDNRFYTIQPGDIFFINQYESHHLTQIDQKLHERIILSIYPEFNKLCSSPSTDLDECFCARKSGFHHKVSLNPEEQKKFLYFIHRLQDINGYGADLLERAVYLELMVFLNKLFYKKSDRTLTEEKSKKHMQVDQILTYINQNLQGELTIEELAKQFYISSSYLCRIFKSTTGTTINKYITARRITLAKSLLAEGCSVNEACSLSGFNDYSNFLKTFTRSVGISPKKYAQFTA